MVLGTPGGLADYTEDVGRVLALQPEDGRRLETILKIPFKVLKKLKVPAYVEPEDLIQEANLAIAKQLNEYDPKRSKLTTWCYMVARGAMLNYLDRVGLRDGRAGAAIEWNDEMLVDEKPNQGVAMDEAAELAWLQKAIAKLPLHEREVLVSRMNGETLKDLGRRLSVSHEIIRRIELNAKTSLAAMRNQEPSESLLLPFELAKRAAAATGDPQTAVTVEYRKKEKIWAVSVQWIQGRKKSPCQASMAISAKDQRDMLAELDVFLNKFNVLLSHIQVKRESS